MADSDGFVERFIPLRSRTTGDWFAHPDLKSRLVADAREQSTNMTEVIAGILAGRYGVDHAPSQRRGTPDADADRALHVRIPFGLYQRIAIAASARRPPVGLNREVLAALCAHYDLGMPAKVQHRRQRGSAAPATA